MLESALGPHGRCHSAFGLRGIRIDYDPFEHLAFQRRRAVVPMTPWNGYLTWDMTGNVGDAHDPSILMELLLFRKSVHLRDEFIDSRYETGTPTLGKRHSVHEQTRPV